MVCPECGSEVEEGAAVCAVCEEVLNEADDEPESETEFAALVESADVDFFSLLTARLEEAGIPWFVQREPSLGTQIAMIYVGVSRLAAARALVPALDPVAG